MALAIVVPVTIGIGGFTAMRRFVPSLERHADSRSLSSAFSISAGLFSFVLAFTIGQPYGNFTAAKVHAKTEATAVEQILRVSHGLPPALGAAVRRETLAYATEVRTHDSARQARLDDASISIPDIFKAPLPVGAVLAISGTFYLKPFGEFFPAVGNSQVFFGNSANFFASKLAHVRSFVYRPTTMTNIFDTPAVMVEAANAASVWPCRHLVAGGRSGYVSALSGRCAR